MMYWYVERLFIILVRKFQPNIIQSLNIEALIKLCKFTIICQTAANYDCKRRLDTRLANIDILLEVRTLGYEIYEGSLE